jgi:hypothetical protein
MGGIKVLCGSCCLHCLNPPANYGVAEKIACRVCITLIKVLVNVAAITPFASASPTFEDMSAMASIVVLNLGSFLEEHINW